MKNKVLVLMILVAFVLGFAMSSVIDTIPKDIGTASRIKRLELAIRSYHEKYDLLPKSLEDLVDNHLIKEHLCSDMWGNRISYEVDRDSQCIRLTSQGNPSINHNANIQCVITGIFSVCPSKD